MILLITNKEDSHPTPVIEKLSAHGERVFRLNTEALLTDYEFSWWADANGCDFHIRCIANGLEIRGSEITAIGDRRPEIPKELPIKSTPQIDKHNLDEAHGFLSFLRYYLKDIPSLGSIVGDRPASSKMLQYRIAAEVGFTTPETCFSNRKADIVAMARKHTSLVLKSIDSDNVWDEENDREWVFYAQKVQPETLAQAPEEAFSQTVSFVQNYIEKDFELRVTVVGRQVFACKIDSQILDDDKGKVDWRQGYEHGLKHEPYTLPERITQQCIEFLRRMGLRFGCFDLVVTPSGEYVFLECNPNGQWLWVELETGMKISESIARHLMNSALLRCREF